MNKTFQLFQLVTQCLTLDKHPEFADDIRKRFGLGEIDRERFIQLASNHFVLPAVWHNLKNAKLTDWFTEEYRVHLDELLLLNEQRNTEILEQINEISKALANESIEPVYMKGIGNLLAGLYSYPGERMIGDIDFLVQEEDYLKTADFLMDMGYENQWQSWSSFKEMKHYPRLFRSDVPADVEIHRVAVRSEYSKRFSTSLLFQHKISPSKSQNTFIPSNAHRLIHTFIHSQLSNQGHKFYTPGLRDLYDAWLLSQQVHWREVLEQIEEKEKARVFFEYMEYLFSPEQNLSTLTNKATLKYIRRHCWFMDHPRWHRLYIRGYKLYELLFIRYLKRIFRALFNKKDLCYIFNRLKDPAWYGKHFKGIREQIFGKK